MSNSSGYTRNNQCEKAPKLADADRTYIYDLGEYPVKDTNKERFRNTWSSSRSEYFGHSFKVKIDGQEHEVTVPNQVAREIHISAETEAHPLTFHQKLQPNYVTGNKNKSPAHVNNLKVQNVCYFNSIQSHLQLPNYLRQKSWAIQKEIFANNVKYKDIGKPGNPSIMDLDYSSQVLAHVKKEILPKKKSTKKQKANCGGSQLVNDKGKYDEVLKVLPDIDEYVLAEDEEDDDSSSSGESMSSGEEDTAVEEMNIERKKQHKIKKKKLSKKQKKVKDSKKTKGKEKEKEGVGDDTEKGRRGMATRSSPSQMSVFERSMMPPPPSRANTKSGGEAQKKRRLTFSSEDGAAEETSQSSIELDIFEDANIPKKKWDTHPEFARLVVAGTTKIDALGFESPRKDAKSKETVVSLCTKYNLAVPKKKAEAVKALVRTLAIKRLLARDPSLKDEYDDNSDS